MGTFRMLHVDHYMAIPNNPFDAFESPSGRCIKKVPIIRIFGADKEGSKACLHVHGFYPYIYFLNEPGLVDELERSYMAQIYQIDTVKSTNYYGYYDEEQEFLRLYLYDPKWIKKFHQIFENRKLFWAHIPYILMFFMDNNLRGMSFIDLSDIHWRQGRKPDSSMIENNCDITPISTCKLEGDVRFEWILNKQGLGNNDAALRELWLEDQTITVSPSMRQPPNDVPTSELEKSYIKQLCLTFEVENTIPASAETSVHSTPREEEESWLKDDEFETSSDEIEFDDEDNFMLKALETSNELQSAVKTQQSVASVNSGVSETVNHEYQFITLFSLELHVSTKDDLRPNPITDSIEAAFYCIMNDVPETSDTPQQVVGMIIVDPFSKLEAFSPQRVQSPGSLSLIQQMRTLLYQSGVSLDNIELNVVNDEFELIITLVNIVKTHDPDLMNGYECEKLSWGFLLERSKVLNISISGALSRIIEADAAKNSEDVDTSYFQPLTFSGRLVFSTWMMVRHEHLLPTTSYERIHHFALNERVPCFSYKTLTQWFGENRNRWRVIDYYLTRVVGQMRILEKFDLVAKVSELSRCYGTQFVDVITRGSQIGIESMMLRIANLRKLTPLSPTVAQRNKMTPIDAFPLVMEPESNIYYDPVAVLDFHSLYPSIVVAYNYCYSTCLGRVGDIEKDEPHHFGCSDLYVMREKIRDLLKTNSISVAPCGVAFVKKNIRAGVLPEMLNELITTRAMVKEQMKQNAKSNNPNRRLQKILNHRQHGLKMMANTTYGYTGATHTGRMPCVEIADSIVSKGREILENAMILIKSREEWGARVVYGDTDSIFIHFPNCDKNTAFKRSQEMVTAITESNPHPIRMKFEKIYQPCVLQTKKRYCGFKYETPDQKEPEFEAKGNETVRRNSCPIAVKMLEMSLKIHFTTRDIDKVKNYCQRQFVKVMLGKLSDTRDFIFSNQYRPRDTDKEESIFVPAWQIARRLVAKDPRAEPCFKQRIPFIIIYGDPGTPLVQLAKTPIEMLENLSMRVNAEYYIMKMICPTLNRVFGFIGVDTTIWFKALPRQTFVNRSHFLAAQKQLAQQGGFSTKQQSTISQYFAPAQCLICSKSFVQKISSKKVPSSSSSIKEFFAPSTSSSSNASSTISTAHICDICIRDKQVAAVRLSESIMNAQKRYYNLHQICKACSSLERKNPLDSDHLDFEDWNPCVSFDCDNLFLYHQARLDVLDSNLLAVGLKELTG